MLPSLTNYRAMLSDGQSPLLSDMSLQCGGQLGRDARLRFFGFEASCLIRVEPIALKGTFNTHHQLTSPYHVLYNQFAGRRELG